MRKRLIDSVSIEELKQMYESGMSFRDIGDSLGVSYQTIRTHLKGIVSPRGVGGYHARRIPAEAFRAPAQKADMQQMDVQNSANACLVVENKLINLEGVIGKYMVDAKSKTVVCQIAGATFDIQPDTILTLVEELKALGRNVGQMTVGSEMW